MKRKITSITTRIVLSVFVFCYSFVQAPTALTAVGLSDLIREHDSSVMLFGLCSGSMVGGNFTCGGTCPDANKTCTKLEETAAMAHMSKDGRASDSVRALGVGDQTCLCIE